MYNRPFGTAPIGTSRGCSMFIAWELTKQLWKHMVRKPWAYKDVQEGYGSTKDYYLTFGHILSSYDSRAVESYYFLTIPLPYRVWNCPRWADCYTLDWQFFYLRVAIANHSDHAHFDYLVDKPYRFHCGLAYRAN